MYEHFQNHLGRDARPVGFGVAGRGLDLLQAPEVVIRAAGRQFLLLLRSAVDFTRRGTQDETCWGKEDGTETRTETSALLGGLSPLLT